MKILWIFLGDHHKIRLYLGVISMHFGVFFKFSVQNGGILGGAIISNIYIYFFFLGGVLKFIFFFWGGGLGGWGVYGRCWARAYV